MVRVVFKHGQQLEFTRRMVEIKSKKFERVMTSFTKVLSDHLYERFVQHVEKNGPFYRASWNQNYVEALIMQGMLRILHFIKATDQLETF